MIRCLALAYILIVCAMPADIYSQANKKTVNLEVLAELPQPNVQTNDVWGYVDDSGREYAIVGTRAEAIIYDITIPDQPVEVKRVPGATSIWRDFKVYKDYIYQTTDQGTDGLRIIDMTDAPDNITTKTWTEAVEIGGSTEELRTCHNLWIDTLSGRAFLAGCNVGRGGALILDIDTDPLNPVVIGAVNETYAHDLFTRGDLLYASEINDGNLGIYDISDISAPVLLSRTPTTSDFTHNAWTSDDGQYIFTTDERPNSFVDAYDISDPTNPRRIDTYQPPPETGVIPHNVHYIDGYIVASWYSEGVIILDAHRPHNLIKVGQYDTAPNSTSGGSGCWGAYPYFPSGTVLASDMASGLFVLKPTYQRASYLEGKVVDADSTDPINNAQLTLLTEEPISDVSDATGAFATGAIDQGTFQVVVSHPAYLTDTITVSLANGDVTEVLIPLRRKTIRSLSGSVSDNQGQPIANAVITIQSSDAEYIVATEALGTWSADVFEEELQYTVAAWGYEGKSAPLTSFEPINVRLDDGYEDDFFADLGWMVTSDARSGDWERGVPIGTVFGTAAANPGEDVPGDIGAACYMTGNGGGNAGFDDVDNGSTALISPPIDIEDFVSPIIEVATWFNNTGGNTPLNDTLQIYIRLDGRDTLIANVLNEDDQGGRWRDMSIELGASFFDNATTTTFQVVFVASDLLPDGHLVEAGIDAFRVIEGATTSTDDDIAQEEIDVLLWPNPVTTQLFFEMSKDLDIRGMKVLDVLGRIILDTDNVSSPIQMGGLQSGKYYIQFETDNRLITKSFIAL